MKNITINGKEYKIKPIDFSAICQLEELGLDVTNVGKQTFTTLRALASHTMGVDVEVAGREIEKHLSNGGKIEDFRPLFNNLADSDFFRNISQ